MEVKIKRSRRFWEDFSKIREIRRSEQPAKGTTLSGNTELRPPTTEKLEQKNNQQMEITSSVS